VNAVAAAVLDDVAIVCTRFRTLYEEKGTEFPTTWGEVCKGLNSPVTFPAAGLRQKPDGKYDKPLQLTGFALARFSGDRSLANVVESFAIGLDFDGTWTMTEAQALFEREGLEAVIHSTFNDTGDGSRFRAFVLYSRPATTREHTAVFAYFRTLCGGRADEQAKDASRFWYGPGVIEGRRYSYEHVPGRPLDLDMLDLETDADVPGTTDGGEADADAPTGTIGAELRLIARTDPHWPVVVNEAENDAETEAPCISGQGGHNRLLQFARKLRQFYGLPRDEAKRIMGIFSARCSPPWSDAELEHKLAATGTRLLPASGVASGWAEYQIPGGVGALGVIWWPLRSPKNRCANDNAAPRDERGEPLFARLHEDAGGYVAPMPEQECIDIDAKRFHENVETACKALAKHPEVFQRGGELVRLIYISEAEAKAAQTETDAPLVAGTPTIRRMSFASLLPFLSSVATFRTTSAKRDDNGNPKTRYSKPDKDLVAAVHGAGVWPGMRTLKGIIETPLMRPDGSILQTPGYDPATGYLYAPGAARFPLIPTAPTRDDARAALAELSAVFVDFPYIDDPSSVVPIAALLSVVARTAIKGNVPAFLFEAAIPGSGKGLQAEVVAQIATGRSISLYEFPASEEEAGKRVNAIARRGLPVFSFDNVKKGVPIGGAALEAAVTCNGKLSIRILGLTEAPDCDWYSVVLLTGNNPSLCRDMVRRTLRSRLHPPVDGAVYQNPNLVEHALAERPRLVSAALTLLRAYLVAGRPATIKRVRSFEAWSDLIPSAIVWAGGADAALSVPDADADESGEAVHALIRAWPAGQTLGAESLLAILKGGAVAGLPLLGAESFAFQSALAGIVDAEFPTANKIGRKLRAEKGVTCDGKELHRDDKTKLWGVAVVPCIRRV
jgi:hypothetical protein